MVTYNMGKITAIIPTEEVPTRKDLLLSSLTFLGDDSPELLV